MSDSRSNRSPLPPPEEYYANRPTELPPEIEARRIQRANETLVPETTAGMPPTAQLFHARINWDGTLVVGLGVTFAERVADNWYFVQFAHDVSRSSLVATVGPVDGDVFWDNATVTVVFVYGNYAYFQTWVNSSPYPAPFHLHVAT